MKIIRLKDHNCRFMSLGFTYRVNGNIPKEFLGYDPDDKLITFLYNHDKDLQQLFTLDECKEQLSVNIFDTDDAKEIQF